LIIGRIEPRRKGSDAIEREEEEEDKTSIIRIE